MSESCPVETAVKAKKVTDEVVGEYVAAHNIRA